MSKVCDYCKKVGPAYTFWRSVDAVETICSACLKVLPTDSVAGRRKVHELTYALTTAKHEAESLATGIWEQHYKEATPQWRLCDTVAGVISQIDNMYVGLRDALTTAREENERLTAENATLRAATRGKTFFHSDEEVNAEMGRLRANVERYGKALKIYADEDQWSSAYMDPWKLRFESRHMDGNGWDTAREALKEPQ